MDKFNDKGMDISMVKIMVEFLDEWTGDRIN